MSCHVCFSQFDDDHWCRFWILSFEMSFIGAHLHYRFATKILMKETGEEHMQWDLLIWGSSSRQTFSGASGLVWSGKTQWNAWNHGIDGAGMFSLVVVAESEAWSWNMGSSLRCFILFICFYRCHQELKFQCISKFNLDIIIQRMVLPMEWFCNLYCTFFNTRKF